MLRAPSGSSIRPTSDKVREASFDMLASLVDIDGARVADLFAGSGAMGIEALSRGAGSAVFVDNDPLALRTVRSNLTSVGLDAASVSLVRADVPTWLARTRDEQQGRFELALVDPPYAFDDWAQVLEHLDTELAVLESDREVELPDRFNVIRARRYGGTLVTVVRAAAHRRSARGAS